MTPKEVVAKGYECFNTGDMETFVTLFHADVVVTINGMHIFSGVHEGIDAWMGCLLYTSPSPRDRSLSRMPSSA